MTTEAVAVISAMAVVVAQGINIAVVRAIVRSELSNLTNTLPDTYMSVKLCKAVHGETTRRLAKLEHVPIAEGTL